MNITTEAELGIIIRERRKKQGLTIAELSMILNFCGTVKNSENGCPELEVRSENSAVLRKCFTLLKKTFNINDSVLKDYPELQGKTGYYQFSLTSVQDVESILEACKWEKNVDGFLERPETISSLRLMRAATSSEAFTEPELMAIN